MRVALFLLATSSLRYHPANQSEDEPVSLEGQELVEDNASGQSRLAVSYFLPRSSKVVGLGSVSTWWSKAFPFSRTIFGF